MSSGDLGKAVLIHFSGPDHPGLTTEITSILARHEVEILDIGQAVVHEALSLGMLVRPSTQASFTTLKAELTSCAHDLNLQARFTSIRPDALQHWLQGLRQQHFIITMLGR